MCGILGFAAPDSVGPQADAVLRGLVHLRHRGPDSERTVALAGAGARCVLGHTRLKIIDLTERADQPLSNEDGSIHISYNGEIYNFRELREELYRAGHRFVSAGDTEVIVHLYEAVGGDVQRLLGRLRGMFAFALFDSRRGRLLLARDRWGIKPIYYAHMPGNGIAFASESRALVHAGLCGSEPDVAAVGAWLRRGVVSGTDTLFADVRALLPGEALEWTVHRYATQPWWQPDPRPDPALADPVEATRVLTVALDDAVARHLVSDRPVGLFLSGGLDSTAVARVAARQGGRLRALTLTCGEDGDRTIARSAAAAARETGAEWTEVSVNGHAVADRLDTALRAFDQPSWDGLNTWLVSAAAAEHDFVVCLSGLGGDELFGGYPSFDLVPRVLRASRGLRAMPGFVRRGAVELASRRSPGGRLVRALDAERTHFGALAAVRGLFASREVDRLMGRESPNARRAEPHELPHGLPDRTVVSLLELRHYMSEQLLRDTDSVAMANSIEIRVPLIDDVVSRVALAVPESVRFAPGKVFLARAAGVGATPPKKPFALPLDAWLRGPLRERAREALLSDALPLAKLLVSGERARIWNAFLDRRAHASRVWALLVLRLWPAGNGLSWTLP